MRAADGTRRVAVAGGGVAGMATALNLLDRARDAGVDLQVTVFEAGAEPGGHLRTIRDDGWQLEWGPNGFLDNEPATLRLVDRLDLRDRLVRSSDLARIRFLLKDGRLHELPASPPAFLKTGLLGVGAKLRVAGELFVPARRADAAADPAQDETIYEFGVRRLGREFAEIFLDPMVKGVFGGDARRISLAAAFPRMVELERDHGGLFKALAAISKQKKKAADAGPSGVLHSFQGGMADLIDALAAALRADPRAELRTGAPVQTIARDGDLWRVDGDGPFHAVIAAAPAHATAPALPDAELAAEVAAIPYSPMAVITLGFRRQDVGHPLQGFGHLVPSREKKRLLGALWTSSIFPGRAPAGHVLLRCMAGGPGDPAVLEQDDDALVSIALGELEELLELKADPVRHWVIRHPRAIAQYLPGHMARLRRMDARLAELPGLLLTGSSYKGISVNYCAKEAELAADAALAHLRGADRPRTLEAHR